MFALMSLIGLFVAGLVGFLVLTVVGGLLKIAFKLVFLPIAIVFGLVKVALFLAFGVVAVVLLIPVALVLLAIATPFLIAGAILA